MLSVKNAGLQFMFRVGQLRKEYNLLWEHEYNGYHGLRSIDDIHLMTLENIAKKRLAPKELNHCFIIFSSISLIMDDLISFYLLSMIMLLDTSNLEKDYQFDINENGYPKDQRGTPVNDVNLYKTFGYYSFSNCVPSLTDVFIGNDEIAADAEEGSKPQMTKQSSDHKNKSFEERFDGIKKLKRHYTILLHNHLNQAEDKMERTMGDTEAILNRFIESVKQITYYASFLMK